jgi:hypothetical protein
MQSLKFGQNFSSSPYIFNMGAATGGLNNITIEEMQKLAFLQKILGL